MADIITKDMGIMEAIQKYPDVVGVFVAHGLGCIGCAMANFETIEQGAVAHGMDIDSLMADLHKVASPNKDVDTK